MEKRKGGGKREGGGAGWERERMRLSVILFVIERTFKMMVRNWNNANPWEPEVDRGTPGGQWHPRELQVPMTTMYPPQLRDGEAPNGALRWSSNSQGWECQGTTVSGQAPPAWDTQTPKNRPNPGGAPSTWRRGPSRTRNTTPKGAGQQSWQNA